MPQADSKTVEAQLKKGELHNLYYLYGQNVSGVEKLTKKIIRAAVGENEDFSLTRLEGRYLDFSELYDMIQIMPMMSEYNCILINDYNCEKPRDDMRGQTVDSLNKKLLETIKEIPSQTVVIFNVTGFEVKTKYDRKSKKQIVSDKNKKLADFIAKNGIVCELTVKTTAELAKDISASVSARGGMISLDNARELAEMCLSDTLTIANEIDKLCAYAQGREITRETLNEMVHRHSGVTVFNLADAVASFNKKAAFDALDELMAYKENRGSILANITNSFLDLYRAACAKKSGKQVSDVMSDYSYIWSFKVEKAFQNSSRMSLRRLRECIKILRDTTAQLNSTSTDEKTVLEQTVTKMLMTKN